ncbi:unnamed protein product [Meganyctiphanes norvegica]|uniref:Uncharacterized protein n=1 Tax=Meganyctiphanes norvegica TaxID=48144 RepID=A0AAV2S9Z1_MEGNR
MALKISFRFSRRGYSGTTEEIQDKITRNLVRTLNQNRIQHSRLYTPSRESIKAIFINEADINKAIELTDTLKTAGFEPRISMALKTARTVYCFGFDPSLIAAYSQNNIEEILTTANWKIRGVYIMNSKRSFKIEFQTTTEAKNS